MRSSKTLGAIVKFGIALAVIGAVVTGTGCGALLERGAKEAVERETGVKVDEDGGKVKIETDKGTIEAESGEGKLAEGFPAEFPIYEPATVKSSTKASTPQGTAYTAALETSDDQAKVAAFYKTTLPQKGYKITNTVTTPQGTSFLCDEGEAMVAVTTQDGKTQVVITITKK